jgi:hypothetical protein
MKYFQFFVIAAAHSLIEVGVFEAVPACGSIGVRELAVKCQVDEALISLFHLTILEEAQDSTDLFSPIYAAAHLCIHI